MASQADDNRCDNGGNKSAPSQTDTGDASIIDAKSDVEKSEKKEPSDNCVICMDTISSSKRLDCGHVFCVDCIDDYFKKCQPKCPSCGKVFGALRGNQPPGTFRTNSSSVRLSGYEQFRSIEIHYNFPNGIQTV
jgi:hypothetical protein